MTQYRTFTNSQLVGRGLDSIDLGGGGTGGTGDTEFRPVSYATVAEARTALGAPNDANYVVWDNSWTHLRQAFTALSTNDILVLPEREEPYWIDSSNGFMASGVSEVTAEGGGRTPIVSVANHWFSMARSKRGILGMGPGAVIRPTNSGWTAPAQPIPMSWYNLTGGLGGSMVGATNKLIESPWDNPFFANFVLQGRDFGGVAYNGLSSGHESQTNRHVTVKRVHFDGCWRGFAAVPNGETGGLAFLRGTYLIENCDFHSVNGTSPIMWNRNNGGTMRNTRVDAPNVGMITFWESLGTNTFENVWVDADKTGINLEQNRPGFSLNWTGGKIHMHGSGNKFHVNIQPEHGSIPVTLHDVDVSPNAFTPNAAVFHVYTTPGIQRRSDVVVSGTTLPSSLVPAGNWIN